MHLFKKITLAMILMGLFTACSSGSDESSDFDFDESGRSLSVSGELTTSDDDQSEFYYDVIDLGNIRSSETLQATITPNGFDVYVFLVNDTFSVNSDNSEDNVLAVFDSVGTDEAEEINLDFSDLGSDEYFLYITSAHANEVGEYDVDITILDTDDVE